MPSPLLTKLSPVKTLVANSDPATLSAVWPRTMWVQTDDDDTPTSVLGVYVRNEANTAWLPFPNGSGAAALDDLVDVNTAGLSDGDVLAYSSGSSTWVPVPPGSIGLPDWLSVHPDRPPTTPNAADDEFDDGAGMSGPVNGLDSQWAWRNQGSASATFADKCLIVTAPANSGNNLRIVEQSLPGGNWKYRAKIALFQSTAYASNFCSGGLILYRTASGQAYAIEGSQSTGWSFRFGLWTNLTTFSTTYQGVVNTFTPAHWLYLELEYDGTNIISRFSFTGLAESFQFLASRTPASDLGGAPDKIGIHANVNNVSHSAKTVCGWFRRIS